MSSAAAARDARQAGFTIIETLIVMAIAGLILAIVFGALPALERNSRNNQRKQDVTLVLEAVSHYELNNSGVFPPAGSNFLQYQQRHFSYYNNPSGTVNVQYGGSVPANFSGVIVNLETAASSPGSIAGNNNLNTIEIYNYQLCNPNTTGASTKQGAGYYDTVALYALENSNGAAPQCQRL